jgi:protein subunit release factor B
MIELLPHEDFKLEVLRPPGPGGQHAGTVPTTIRITHLPSGAMAQYGACRSQHLNKAIASEMLLAALTHPRHNR